MDCRRYAGVFPVVRMLRASPGPVTRWGVRGEEVKQGSRGIETLSLTTQKGRWMEEKIKELKERCFLIHRCEEKLWKDL